MMAFSRTASSAYGVVVASSNDGKQSHALRRRRARTSTTSCTSSGRHAALGLGVSPRGRDALRPPSAISEEKSATSGWEASDAIDWDNIGFSCEHTTKTQMFVATATPAKGGDASSAWEWCEGGLQSYQPLSLDPSAQVLNYGQSIFEGLKAQRTSDGKIVLFRPDQNAARMTRGASRMAMAAPPLDTFMAGVTQVVRANASLVPPHGKGALYIRPLLLGTGAILGLGPAPEFTFLVYCAPVGAYFKSGQITPISLQVETSFHRAAPGGTGDTKCAGNYSPVLTAQLPAKEAGFSDVLYLDAVHNRFVEEVSSCNIFGVFGNTVVTPPLSGTILPGVTRMSVLDLARKKGFAVEEKPLAIDALLKADEVFCTGTAVVLSPVGEIAYGEEGRKWDEEGWEPTVAYAMYEELTGIQQQKMDDPFGWVVEVKPERG